jgi:hypothetical protein
LCAGFLNRRGSLGGLGCCFCASFGHDRHDLCAGLNRVADTYRLDLLDLFVCPQIDLVEILAEAIEEPANFFGHACHGEKLVCLADVLGRCAVAPAAKSVDEMPGLICRDAACKLAQFLGAIDELSTFEVLRLCCAVKVLRIGERPGAGHDHGRELAGRHTRRRDRRYHLTPRSQQTFNGPLSAPKPSFQMVWS